RFLDFRFVFDFGAMAFCEPDDFAEKLFVNLAENVGRQDRKFVWTFGIIESPDDFLKNGIVDIEPRREIVRRFDAIFFFLEMEQAGVVTFVGFAEKTLKSRIGVLAI